jgi:hypothetical protein
MEDKQSIKKVPESQGDVHEKVANQSNLELPSSSPTRSPGPPYIQIDVQTAYDLRFGHSTYTRKDKEITFSMALVSCPNKIGVVRNHQNSTDFQNHFWCCALFWPDGPCIQLESIRDASWGSATTLDPLYSVAAIILHGFCLD